MREIVPNLCHDTDELREIASIVRSAPTRPTLSAAQQFNKYRAFWQAIDMNVQRTSGDICAVSVPDDIRALQEHYGNRYLSFKCVRSHEEQEWHRKAEATTPPIRILSHG